MTRIYRLEREQWVPCSRNEVFEFFSSAQNLELITPPWMGFRILTPSPIRMADDTRIDYRIRLAGIPVRWRTRIRAWRPPFGFIDEQERGPYASWVHTHRFEETDGGTLMTDRVLYSLPFGLLGRLVHPFAVRTAVSAIFDHRFDRIRELLGSTDPRGGGQRSIGDADRTLLSLNGSPLPTGPQPRQRGLQ